MYIQPPPPFHTLLDCTSPPSPHMLNRALTICLVLNDKKIILKELDEKCDVDDIESDIEESEEVMLRLLDKYRRIGQDENRDENE